MQDVLKNYGGGKLTAFDFNGETAAIRKLGVELNRICAAELKMLDLSEAVAQLEADNLAFATVYKDRNALEEENKQLFEMQQVRGQLSKIYTGLCKQIELLSLTFPEKSKKIQEFSVALNVLIGKYRPLIASEKKKKKRFNFSFMFCKDAIYCVFFLFLKLFFITLLRSIKLQCLCIKKS